MTQNLLLLVTEDERYAVLAELYCNDGPSFDLGQLFQTEHSAGEVLTDRKFFPPKPFEERGSFAVVLFCNRRTQPFVQ